MTTTRKTPCDHDKVYSGQINPNQHYAFICRRCGESGWDTEITLSRVSGEEYYAQRVAHGWASPAWLPRDPKLPRVAPVVQLSGTHEPWRALVIVAVAMSLFCLALGGLGELAWGKALIAAGAFLGVASVSIIVLGRTR